MTSRASVNDVICQTRSGADSFIPALLPKTSQSHVPANFLLHAILHDARPEAPAASTSRYLRRSTTPLARTSPFVWATGRCPAHHSAWSARSCTSERRVDAVLHAASPSVRRCPITRTPRRRIVPRLHFSHRSILMSQYSRSQSSVLTSPTKGSFSSLLQQRTLRSRR